MKMRNFSGRGASRIIRSVTGMSLCLGMLFFAAFSPATSFAGQTITIDGNSGGGTGNVGDVFGNGAPPDGFWNGDPALLKSPVNNRVIVKDGAVVMGDVFGGQIGAPIFMTGGLAVPTSITGDVTVSGNRVSISGGTIGSYYVNASGDIFISGNVYGGYAWSGEGSAMASGNRVSISGGTIGGFFAYPPPLGPTYNYGDIFGGFAWSEFGTATATGNSVFLSGDAVVHNDVYGGLARSDSGTATATATGNSVFLSGDAVVSGVSGGAVWSDSGTATATGNRVFISGGDVSGAVVGGFIHSDSGTATATGNSVFISGGDVYGGVSGGYARSDYGTATATGNSVFISGGEVNNDVFGGCALTADGTATATGNRVFISGGEVNNDVFGGYAHSESGTATATGNSVFISGGEVNNDVFGGYAYRESGTASATGNSVFISGNAVVSGSVFGGEAWSYYGTATATNNSIFLSGAPDLTGSDLFGGHTYGTGDAFAGNTLNVWNYAGSAVDSLQNFEFINFVFPTSQSGPVLEVSNVAFLGATDGTGRSTTVTASTLGGPDPLRPGATVTLLAASPLIFTAPPQTTASGQHGATLRYTWTLETDWLALTHTLTATLDKVEANPQAKALSEAFVSGLTLVNQGADLAAGQGMARAVSAAGQSGSGFGSFGTLAVGQIRHNTGSHVDVSSFSLLAGLSFGTDTSAGRLTLGAFFEYGNGSYDTRNSFSNAASVHGDGTMYHMGGGVLGRMDFTNTGPGHFYTEASLRAGGVHNEYNASDLRDGAGRSADYDSSSTYYGLHLGAGYVWNITEAASLDLYGKYFWTRQQGDTVTLDTDDRVRFDDVDSHRARGGARFTYAVSEQVAPYLGAAYEHEFDGKARATTYGHSIEAPDLKGGTGMGELGLSLKPSPTSPLYLDLGVQGYTGMREGVTGSLQMKLEF